MTTPFAISNSPTPDSFIVSTGLIVSCRNMLFCRPHPSSHMKTTATCVPMLYCPNCHHDWAKCIAAILYIGTARPRQNHLNHETLPSPYRRLEKSLYVGGFHVILGAYTPGSRRIPAVEPLVARRVLILACTIACKSLWSLPCRYRGIWIHPDQMDIETRKYEGKEVYDVHGARFERTTSRRSLSNIIISWLRGLSTI